MSTSSRTLIIFYDGFCPLCQIEMRSLKAKDKQHNIEFIDVQDESAMVRFPELEKEALLARLHAYFQDGLNQRLLTGLDVTYQAWKCVGRGWLIAWLRWPGIRTIADFFYIKFAKHRYKISFLLTGKQRCESCRL